MGIAVANGTVALEAALRAVGVEAGDEVIVPAVTFVASASAVLQANAIPIFVDCDPRNYTIDPAAVEAAITPQTRAVMPVDYGGMPCDMDALQAIATKHDIAIVSDCAHSHGSQWKGVGTGAIGDCGGFSFQMGKTLTTRRRRHDSHEPGRGRAARILLSQHRTLPGPPILRAPHSQHESTHDRMARRDRKRAARSPGSANRQPRAERHLRVATAQTD